MEANAPSGLAGRASPNESTINLPPLGHSHNFRAQQTQEPNGQQQQPMSHQKIGSASCLVQAAPAMATSSMAAATAVGLPLSAAQLLPASRQCLASQQPLYSQVYRPQPTMIHQPHHHHLVYSQQPQQLLEQRTNFSLNLQLQQQQQQQQQQQLQQQQPFAFQASQKSTCYPFLLTGSPACFVPQQRQQQQQQQVEKSACVIFGGRNHQLDSSPTETAATTATCSSVGTNTDQLAISWLVQNSQQQQHQSNNRLHSCEFSSSQESQHLSKRANKGCQANDDRSPVDDKVANQRRQENDSKLKCYLMRFILASNIPFAYAIILVAFLITVIAATSIITILTIILTITGYTAYPSTESTFNTSLAIGVVCASFALALVSAALIVWRRHCQAAYYYLDDPQSQASRATNSPQLSETYDGSEYGSVPVCDWSKHVQKLHVDGDIGFSREFEQIQQSSSANLTCEHSQMAENKHKNRYINIVAYDHTRVTLRTLPGQKKPGADYINANFIDGYNKPRAYIGTQGPLVSTFDDYWRMIWEQRVVIIVMITNLQERGRRKCDMYWPKEGTETYGNVQVKLLQEVVMATYTLRTFTVKNLKMKKKSLGSERTVYQYHYTNWPDHGVPDHPLPVLSFVRKSASANPNGAGAIICHCSAGCGRSGTYIVIDAMLKQIRHRQSINVVDFLKHIRSQRNYLVQTEEQYIFIHDALVVAIDSGETEIAANCIAKYIQLLQNGGPLGCGGGGGGTATLSQKDSSYSITAANGGLQASQQQALSVSADSGNQQLIGSQSNLLPLVTGKQAAAGGGLGASLKASSQSIGGNARNQAPSSGGGSGGGQWSLLERQYRLLTKFDANDFAVVSALKPCNRTKNRTINIIPIEGRRVHITPKPGADGSDYINASFLMGFNHLREFIVTQHPVFETFSDFWQMVYDHNSQTIVLLTQMADQLKEFPQFWPQKEDEVDYGSFKVKLTQESTLVKDDNSNGGGGGGGLIIARDFIMRSNQDDYELQTRLIHCPGWPECCGPLSSVFDLIQVVQQATQQQASQQKLHDGLTSSTTVTIGHEHEPQNGGPIIVVDKFGGTEAATFAVLTTLFKQINFEDAVDVYMYAKLAHQQRPGIWRSQDDYLFLYRAIESYASSMAANEAANNSAAAASGGGAQKLLLGANSAPSSAAAAANQFAHQTMTLDRHKHKSQSRALMNSTSTMRRAPPAAQAAAANQSALASQARESASSGLMRDQQQQQPITMELSKSSNQIVQLVDQNHNSLMPLVSGVGNQKQQQQQQQLIGGLQRALIPAPPQQQQLLLQRQQLNNVSQQQMNQIQQLKQSIQSQNNSSPFNGGGLAAHQHQHQHLGALASNGRGVVPAQTNPQQQQQQQQLVGDHYLYSPMN